MVNEKILDLVGIPFSDVGESPQEGFDCYGLVVWVYKHIYGIDIPSYRHEEIEPMDSLSIQKAILRAYKEGKWELVDNPIEPSLLTIKNHPVYVNHVGVYVGDGKFIHSLKKVGVILSKVNDRFWSKRIVGVYRWKK